MEQKVYKNPAAKVGSPLIATISSGCKTPLLSIKYCNIVRPFYYPNSPTIARYSVTCIVDPEIHSDFLKGIQAIEKNENVESVIKKDSDKEESKWVNTGKLNIKFQTKDLIPVYVLNENGGEPIQIKLEDDIARDESVVVVYDILRYTKKNAFKSVEHGISFKPSCVYYYPKDPL